MCPGVGLEGWFRWFAHPFGGVESGGTCSTLSLTPCFCSWLSRSSSWAFCLFVCFCIFLSIICPNCTCTPLFLVLFNFFVLCAGTAAKSPSSPPVLNPLVACSLAPTYLQLLLRRTGKGKRKKHQVRPLKNCCFCWSS